jgi:hypothetical protein
MSTVLETILGNRSATQVLLFLEAYGSGHANRMAKTYGVSVNAVYRQLRRLESGGVLVSRMVGSARVFEFNSRNPTVGNLRRFLSAELDQLPTEELHAYYRQRQRPRRTGKQ